MAIIVLVILSTQLYYIILNGLFLKRKCINIINTNGILTTIIILLFGSILLNLK